MGVLGGGLLRTLATVFYFITFCAAIIVLGIFSYFLSKLGLHHLPIATTWAAVEGLATAAVLYTIFCVVLTICLGGVTFFATLAIFLDLVFMGVFIAIAVLTREAVNSCGSNLYVYTPLGDGYGGAIGPAGTKLVNACRENQAAFAVSIIAAVLFFFCAILQYLVAHHHQHDRREKHVSSPARGHQHHAGRSNGAYRWSRSRRTVGYA